MMYMHTCWLQAQFHSSGPVQGSLQIPERLVHIPEAEDPGFFEMVEYFFHKSCVLIEDRLVDVNMKNIRASRFVYCIIIL